MAAPTGSLVKCFVCLCPFWLSPYVSFRSVTGHIVHTVFEEGIKCPRRDMDGVSCRVVILGISNHQLEVAFKGESVCI